MEYKELLNLFLGLFIIVLSVGIAIIPSIIVSITQNAYWFLGLFLTFPLGLTLIIAALRKYFS